MPRIGATMGRGATAVAEPELTGGDSMPAQHTDSPQVFFQRLILIREDGTIVERPINAFFGEGIAEEVRRRREECATSDADQGAEHEPDEE